MSPMRLHAPRTRDRDRDRSSKGAIRRGSRSRILTRAVATVAVGAVVTTGSVVLAPAEPAQAAWQGTTQTWISSLNSAIGTAGKLFGVETGPFNIAMTLAGPLISSIFGTGGGPGIQDVLDKLQELDDIENKLDQMQGELLDIEQSVLKADQDVLFGTCTIQTSVLTDYIAKLQTSQASYSQVIEEIDTLRASGGSGGQELKNYVNSFIETTLGDVGHTNVVTSAMAKDIRLVHQSMLTTQGGAGVIQSCGKAFFDRWKLDQTSVASRTATGANDQGVWLDDRQYYEPLQELVEYWQTAQSQGMFLLQQASLMQAAKLYTADTGTIDPEQAAGVCALAAARDSGNAKTVCNSGLVFSKTFYENITAEWKQVGLPISNDKVVLSLGSDLTGLKNGNDSIGTAVWARNPRSFPVDWAGGSWQTTAAATTVDGISGFVPANSARWKDLEASYRTSHLSITPTVQAPAQLFKDNSQPWSAAQVAPFAPLDILSTLQQSLAPGGETRNFDTTGVTQVWMPGETATRDMPAFKEGLNVFEGNEQFLHVFGDSSGLTFPPTSMFSPGLESWESDTGLTVKCMVIPVDGALCDSEWTASWFIARQSSAWGNRDKVFSVSPSSGEIDKFEAQARTPHFCASFLFPDSRVCDYTLDIGVTKLPNWLATFKQQDGTTFEPRPSNQTLWPAAPVPAECGKTVWGVPTRCGASMDAWLKANIPNPSLSGPVAVSAPVVTAGTLDGWATCVVPAWADVAGETGVPVQTGDITWTAFRPGGDTFTTTTAKDVELRLIDFAKQAKWYPDKVADRPASFTLRCTITARFADLATTSTVTSALASVRLVDGARYYVISTGAEEPATPTTPAVPSAPPGPGEAAGSGSGTAALAATGSSAAPWLAGSVLVLLAGAALAIATRLRRRTSD